MVDSSLFSATLATQQAILLVRSLCERACSSITGVGEKEHAICLLYVDHQTTFTLADFVEAQARQAEEAKEKLAKLRSNVLAIVKDACEVCFLCCKGKYYYFSSLTKFKVVRHKFKHTHTHTHTHRKQYYLDFSCIEFVLAINHHQKS